MPEIRLADPRPAFTPTDGLAYLPERTRESEAGGNQFPGRRYQNQSVVTSGRFARTVIRFAR